MKKEDRLLYAVIWTFYGIGGFCLASFVLLGFFLDFIVHAVPSCYFTVDYMASVECGPSFFEKALANYLNFFSHSFSLIFENSFKVARKNEIESWLYILPLIIGTVFLIFLVNVGPFVIAYKLLKRLVWGSPQQRRIAFTYLSLILLPTLCMGALKVYFEPPRFISSMITVDLWHTDLKIERRLLEKWSIVSYPKPEKELSQFEFHYIGSHKYLPFARLEVSYRELDPTFDDDEKVFIKIEPHYEVRTEAELIEKRQKYFDSESPYWNSPVRPVFKPAGRQMGFEVFEFIGSRSGQPDFYLQKNENGGLEKILECTPDTHCVKPFGRGFDQKPCGDEEECKSCKRICTDKSQGTEMLNIEYRFDKKYLGSYFALHQAVLDFVAARTVEKMP